MTLAKKHYKKNKIGKMVDLMRGLTTKVIETYGANRLERDKMERFINVYLTEPMVNEAYRMNAGISKAQST